MAVTLASRRPVGKRLRGWRNNHDLARKIAKRYLTAADLCAASGVGAVPDLYRARA
jgi:hypothetical protein